MPERENNRLVKRIDAYGGDILRSSRFRSTRKNIQHGTVSVYEHSISVAGCSLKIMDGLKSLGIRVRERELVRGALLLRRGPACCMTCFCMTGIPGNPRRDLRSCMASAIRK